MRFAAAATLVAMAFAFGAWVLLHPASTWVRPWRAQQTGLGNDVIFGRYPVEEDVPVRRENGVATILSLRNPPVPYENVLLAQERERAERYGMQVLNFPMGSISGRKFGNDYMREPKAAALAALSSEGEACVHCYLGINRAKNVQKVMSTLAASSSYAGAGGSLDDGEAHLRANTACQDGNHELALRELSRIEERTMRALRVAAWSDFRLNRIAQASTVFECMLTEIPVDAGATAGLGYWELREIDLVEADSHFGKVLGRDGQVPAAIEGMGYAKLRQNRLEGAKVLFKRALAGNLKNLETQAALARLPQTAVAQGGVAPPVPRFRKSAVPDQG